MTETETEDECPTGNASTTTNTDDTEENNAVPFAKKRSRICLHDRVQPLTGPWTGVAARSS